MRTRTWRVVAVALVLTHAGACEQAKPPVGRVRPPAVASELEPSEPFGVSAVTLRSPDGTDAVTVPVYDAFTPDSRARGLMGRSHLPAGAGMVFRFPGDRRGGFWMKDTLIPLSIAFFDADGTVVRVLDMPPCEADPCPTFEPQRTYRGALEVNQGFFEDLGVTAGWKVELPAGLPTPS